MKRVVFAMLLPLTVVAVFSCAHIEPPVNVPRVENVRIEIRPVRVLVGVATRAQPIFVSAAREVAVWSQDAKDVLGSIGIDKTPVGFTQTSVTIGNTQWGTPAVILVPDADDQIKVGDTVYPGQIALVKRGESVAAVNFVLMEDYVAGVVTCEMPSYFERSALQTQAVAARTFALWQMKQRRLQVYDVKDDVSDQVYRGLSGTTAASRLASERTRGTVVVYDWQFLPAFFFSTCGGYTVGAAYLRGAPVIPPLSGVKCEYCKASKRYRWAITISAAEIEQALAKAGYLSGSLEDIRVTKTIPGGWVDTVEIVASNGTKQLAGYVLRQVVGTSRLYSTNFIAVRSGANYIFEGRGYGHGVGLCQYGANGMASRGFNFVEILEYYYPGASVKRIY